MSNPLEMAEQLGEAILNSEEYRKYAGAKEEMDNSDEAMDLVEKFQDLQQGLRDAQLMGRKITQEQINELRSHQRAMMENKSISTYLEAKRVLEGLMSAVNETIGRTVGITPPAGGGGCSGGCC